MNGKDIQQIIPLSLLLAGLLVFSQQYIIYACGALAVVILAVIFGERFIYGFVIVTLFTLVGELNRSLRLIIQVTDFSLLTYLFLKRFGLQINLYPRIPKSLFYFLLLYYFSMTASALMSNYPVAGVFLVARQTLFFVIAYIFYALIRDIKDVKVYLVAFIIAACVLAASSVFTLMSESSSLLNLAAGSRERIVGFISNPNNITNFYMVSFPLVLYILLMRKSTLSNTVSLLLMLYFSFALFITLSRSAILGVVASTIVVLYILKRRYFYFVLISLAALVVIFVVFEPLGNLASILFRVGRGVTGRDYLWGISWDIIKENPVFGLGPGAYKYEMFKHFPFMLNSWSGEMFVELYEMTNGANLSHNFFLFFFSEMGILGLISAFALPVIYFTIGIRTIKAYKNMMVNQYYLVVTLFSIGIAMFIRSIFENIGLLSYGVITADLPFWIMFGCLIYFNNICIDSSQEKKRTMSEYEV